MTIDKEYWKKLKFVKGNFPHILCPTCGKGQLKPIGDSIKYKETSESREDRLHNDDWEFEWTSYRFTCILKCNHEVCGDITVCLGTGSNEQDMEYDRVGEMWQQVYYSYYKPKYFLPPLKIIKVNDLYPKDLKLELNNSFSHFFSDLTSCANKIRICVEILMDELKIKKTETKFGKIKNLTLHSRILDYKMQNLEVADYLLAIKWIGNFGSHYDNLTKDDVLDAYTLLDFSLNKIYDNQEEVIKKLSEEINNKKAPLSKPKKKIGL